MHPIKLLGGIEVIPTSIITLGRRLKLLVSLTLPWLLPCLPTVPINLNVGSAPDPVSTQRKSVKSFTATNNGNKFLSPSQ